MSNSVSANGASSAAAETQASPEPTPAQLAPASVFRAHDSVKDPAQKIAESVDGLIDRLDDRFDEFVKQLAAVMAQPVPPIAAMGAPAPSTNAEAITDEVSRIQNGVSLSGEIPGIGRLKRTVLENGDVSYKLPLTNAGAIAAEVAGVDREAFRECSRHGRSYMELVGSSDQQVLAAMVIAKQRWGDDGVVLHVEGKHTDKVIHYAVKAGLNIANRDPETQALVAKERERQANPITHGRTQAERVAIPLLERVPAATGQSRGR